MERDTEFAVSREGTTLVTLHEGSDTTARDEATAELTETLEGLTDEGTIADWTVDGAEVYEHPAGPFDPYTVTVGFAVTVTVTADDADRAVEIGANAIDDALERAEVESISYTTSPAASAS
ncbi:hypothetical protein SAMN05444422_101280 [Halobiforma haloterrestris]|uniref:Uncharacterized protein n=1 Tax=Natronobacterium haloterrestre TaxID=148448 RepID=A0A1I1D4Q1_NATHA|nr:hypothetical protein [Halobiforma haloterrestris]SFB69784.1 hypothetical protein SAMN05444422_101280 [Halobiforma haloterrestris]